MMEYFATYVQRFLNSILTTMVVKMSGRIYYHPTENRFDMYTDYNIFCDLLDRIDFEHTIGDEFAETRQVELMYAYQDIASHVSILSKIVWRDYE